jgi:hypothetical protein
MKIIGNLMAVETYFLRILEAHTVKGLEVTPTIMPYGYLPTATNGTPMIYMGCTEGKRIAQTLHAPPWHASGTVVYISVIIGSAAPEMRNSSSLNFGGGGG